MSRTRFAIMRIKRPPLYGVFAKEEKTMEQNWKLLQIFADGAGAGAGDGGGQGSEATGESAVDAGQQRLLELGVPRDRLPKTKAASKPTKPAAASRAGYAEGAGNKPARTTEGQEPVKAEAPAPRQAGQEDKAGQEGKGAGETPAALDWNAILQNPDFNNRLQYMIRQRLGEEGSAKDKLEALGPVLQKLAKERGVELDVSDMMHLDTEDLTLRMSHDKTFIRKKAAELGVPEETYDELQSLRDNEARRKREERERQLRETFNKHVSGLRAQGEALKGEYPDFDLNREMQNPRFVHMTSPTGGMSVKEAYLAVHGDELLQQRAAEAAQQSRERLSAAVQANQARPRENGTGGPAAPVPSWDYTKLSPQEKQEFRRRIERGEKIYPGME